MADPMKTTPTHVRIPNWLRERIYREARKRRRSLSSEIREALMDRYGGRP